MPAKTIRKSAVSGKFVSKAEAKANPRETYTAVVRAKFKAWVCLSPAGKPLVKTLSDSKTLTTSLGYKTGKVARVTCIVEE